MGYNLIMKHRGQGMINSQKKSAHPKTTPTEKTTTKHWTGGTYHKLLQTINPQKTSIPDHSPASNSSLFKKINAEPPQQEKVETNINQNSIKKK